MQCSKMKTNAVAHINRSGFYIIFFLQVHSLNTPLYLIVSAIQVNSHMVNSLWILSADLRMLNPQWFIVPGHVNDVLQILSTCYRIFLHGNLLVGRILKFSCKFCKSHSKSAGKSTCSTRRFCCEFPPCVNLSYAEL